MAKTLFIYIITCMFLAGLISCYKNNEVVETQIDSTNNKFTYEYVYSDSTSRSLRLWRFTEDSMNYLIIEDLFDDGLAIINLTKDKLETEYFKQQIIK